MTESEAKELLDKATVEKILEAEVYTSAGEKVKLGSQFDQAFLQPFTVLSTYLGHFFCGSCQQYVVQLASVRPEALKEAGAKIVIVGCGQYKPISSYADLTGFGGPILADPTRNLYKMLGLIDKMVLPPGDRKKTYVSKGTLSNILCSIWEGPLKHPDHMGKQGDISQLGGDFIFGPDKECLFAHRMQHTEDHTETADLMEIAGVGYP